MSEQPALLVGLVGCGKHGTALAQAIVRTDALRLVAYADPDELARQRAAAVTAGGRDQSEFARVLAGVH